MHTSTHTSSHTASASRKKKGLTKEKALKRSIPYESVAIEWLQDPAYASTYLKTICSEFNKDAEIKALLTGLRHLAKARGGIQALAKKTGANREHLYRALSPRGNPSLRMTLEVMRVLGLSLEIKPQKKRHKA